jgi:translation initiation factor IF-1
MADSLPPGFGLSGFGLAWRAGMVCIARAIMPDAAIHAEGLVLERRGAVLYRVSLPNGKVILAHLSKSLTTEGADFQVGDLLWLELTPYDFDYARILGKIDKI